jgi:hypothetical protein
MQLERFEKRDGRVENCVSVHDIALPLLLPESFVQKQNSKKATV